MAWTYDYENVATLDPTEPDGSARKVSELDEYIRETRGALRGWYEAQHTEVTYDADDSVGITIDLKAIGLEETPLIGTIILTGGGATATLTKITSGINGQWLCIRGGDVQISIERSGGVADSFALSSSAHTFNQYDILLLKRLGGYWHEVAYTKNGIVSP